MKKVLLAVTHHSSSTFFLHRQKWIEVVAETSSAILCGNPFTKKHEKGEISSPITPAIFYTLFQVNQKQTHSFLCQYSIYIFLNSFLPNYFWGNFPKVLIYFQNLNIKITNIFTIFELQIWDFVLSIYVPK